MPLITRRILPPRARRSIPAGVVALLLAGCLPGFRPTPEPIKTLELVRSTPSGTCTAVMLPGMLDSAKTFHRKDFASLAQIHVPGLEVVAVDAHFGYYRKKTVITRLHEDVVEPLQNEDSRVWFVGTSLGGVGSLLYARGRNRNQPLPSFESPAGLVLLAPFLGSDELLDEIEAAGGPLPWHEKNRDELVARILSSDDGRNMAGYAIWGWLVDWYHDESPDKPRIVLAWGDEDPLDRSGRLLAPLLPKSDVFIRSGGHDWKTWRLLWQDVLEAGVFETCKQPTSQS